MVFLYLPIGIAIIKYWDTYGSIQKLRKGKLSKELPAQCCPVIECCYSAVQQTSFPVPESNGAPGVRMGSSITAGEYSWEKDCWQGKAVFRSDPVAAD